MLASVYALTNDEQETRESFPSEVTLYFLKDSYIGGRSKITGLPSSYPKTYQIPVSGLPEIPKFTTKGSSVQVDADGLVTSKASGTTNISFVIDNVTTTITFVVKDYVNIYVDERIKTILSEIIYDNMTDLQKLQNITRWVGRNTDYCVNYQGYSSMIIFECGDCWASTSTICEFCRRVGIEAKARRGNQDPGAGSGHKNALALFNNSYYIAEAGCSGNRPRCASVHEEPLGFSVLMSNTLGTCIYQYDGNASSVTIPSVIKYNITRFGKDNATVFIFGGLESIHFTAGIQNFGRGALYGTDTLYTITTDPNCKGLEAVDNVLYTKGRKTLLYVPKNKKSFTIDKSTTHIAYTALHKVNLDRLVIPKNVKWVGMAFLYQCKIGELEIEYGLETLEETAFQELSTPKIVLPNSVTDLGIAPFYRCNVSEVVLSKNIKEIPMGCFDSSSVRKVEIPDGVESIGDRAFYSTPYLTEITIPKSVTSIGSEAFGKKIKTIHYSGSSMMWSRMTSNSSLPNTTVIEYGNEDIYEAIGIMIGVYFGTVFAAAILFVILVEKNVISTEKPDKPKAAPAKAEQATASQPAPAPAPARAPAPAPARAPAPAPARAPAPTPARAPAANPRPAPRPAANQPRPAPSTPPRNNAPAPAPRPAPRNSPAPPPRGRPAPPPRY